MNMENEQHSREFSNASALHELSVLLYNRYLIDICLVTEAPPYFEPSNFFVPWYRKEVVLNVMHHVVVRNIHFAEHVAPNTL